MLLLSVVGDRGTVIKRQIVEVEGVNCLFLIPSLILVSASDHHSQPLGRDCPVAEHRGAVAAGGETTFLGALPAGLRADVDRGARTSTCGVQR